LVAYFKGIIFDFVPPMLFTCILFLLPLKKREKERRKKEKKEKRKEKKGSSE